MLVLMLLSAMLLASSQATNFTQCNGGNTVIESVEIAGCEGSGTCNVNYGDSVEITVKFTPTTAADDVNAEMGVYFSQSFRFPGTLDPSNACEGGVTCPMVAGQTYTYTGNFHVSIHSTNEVKGYFALTKASEEEEDTTEDLGCVVIPFQTTKNETASS